MRCPAGQSIATALRDRMNAQCGGDAGEIGHAVILAMR
jgi:hypothetical protein